MNLDKFTTKAQEAILAAQRLAAERNHQLIEPQHLLAALLQQADGIVPSVIAKIGADVKALSRSVEGILQTMPRISGGGVQQSLSRQAANVLSQAEAQAARLKDDYTSTEHLLLALTEDKAMGDLLARVGVTRQNKRFGTME